MGNTETIWVLTDDIPQITVTDDTRSGIRTGGDWVDETGTATTGKKGAVGSIKVSTEKLEQEMTRFLSVVSLIFSRAEQQAKVNSGLQNQTMQLDEIELSVEINGEGEVKLVGSGVKGDGKGAIKLTFRRL